MSNGVAKDGMDPPGVDPNEEPTATVYADKAAANDCAATQNADLG
jgi:hypothetical protein